MEDIKHTISVGKMGDINNTTYVSKMGEMTHTITPGKIVDISHTTLWFRRSDRINLQHYLKYQKNCSEF